MANNWNNNNNFNFDPIVARRVVKFLPRIALVGVVLATVSSSWYTIDPEEVGVVMRFGQYQREVEPGLHFKLPLGVENIITVPVERQLKQEFGFRTVKAGVQSQYSRSDFNDESLMLTGDLNLANVEWVVQYRISNPRDFLFKIKNPEGTLRYMSESCMRQVVGNRTVNDVLTVGRQQIASEVEQRLQILCDNYSTGIKIEQVVLQDVDPPEKVKPSYNAVNEAQQEKEKLINEALAKFNQVIPRARGRAEETIQSAEGYALDRVNRAEGEAARFNDIYKEYMKAPEVTKKRIYLETMERILPKVGQKVITDKKGSNVLPPLQLGDNSSSKKGQ